MKKLVVLTSGFPRWSGDATTPFVLHFATHMARRWDRVLVIAPHFAGARRSETLPGGLRVRRFRYFFPYSQEDIAYGGNAVARVGRSPLYALKLAGFLISSLLHVIFSRASTVNAHWLVPQGLVAVLAKAVTGARVVVTVHGGDVFSLNGPLFRKVKRFVLSRADEVVVNSSATKEACEELYPGREYRVIPMGVDTELFRPAAKSAELVYRHGLNEFTVLFVGRLTEDKGVIYLLQALQRLRESGASFKALIVGSGDQGPALEEFVRANGLQDDVLFLGWVDSARLVDYYNTADVFVGPSIIGPQGWKEALGLVFVEALSTGLPVIATDTGGIRDVVTPGETGLLVEQRSPEQIFERLRELYTDRELLHRLAGNARQAVERQFSWSTVTDRYMDVFASLTDRTR